MLTKTRTRGEKPGSGASLPLPLLPRNSKPALHRTSSPTKRLTAAKELESCALLADPDPIAYDERNFIPIAVVESSGLS